MESASEWLIRLDRHIQQQAQPCVVFSRLQLSPEEVVFLLSRPHVASVILPSEDPALMAEHPDRVGFRNEQTSRWVLPARMARELICVSPTASLPDGFFVWLSLWKAGVRRVHAFLATPIGPRRWLGGVIAQKLVMAVLWRAFDRLGRVMPYKMDELWDTRQLQFAWRMNRLKDKAVWPPEPAEGWRSGHVIMVCGSLGGGGAERQLSVTLQGLAERGHKDLHFLHQLPMVKPHDFYLPALVAAGIPFSQAGMSQLSTADMADGATAELVSVLSSWGDVGLEVFAYVREFRRRRPEIAHIWLDHMNVTAGLAAWIAGVPKIFLSCRSLAPIHFAFRQPYMRPIYRLLAQSSRVVLLNNSEAGARSYADWLGVPPERFRVIRNGLDFSFVTSPEQVQIKRQSYRNRLNIPDDAPVLGVVMRFSEEKRPGLWAEIAQQVAQRMPDVHFLMVGDGPLRSEIDARLKQQISPGRVHLPGHEHDVVAAMAAMDLFLLTSRAEGLPNVLIEAQAIGVPPVSLDVGGASETMENGKTGWLLSSADPQQISATICELLNHPELREDAAHSGPEFVTRRFSKQRMIDETVAAYGKKN